jgi:RNA-directed DNA polymerase
MSDQRQKNQLLLAFMEEDRGEAPNGLREGTESLTAKRRTGSPAIDEQLMEEVCERENCQQALARVKANKGSPGMDRMTVQQLAEPPDADPHVRWCGRGGVVRLSPIPIY